jgi:cytoskeleton protein RodZ
VTDEISRQIGAFSTPGAVLKVAREARGLSQREAADRLNLMPDYVSILERDDYESLRSPTFARGYVRAYGRLLDIEEAQLLQLFDEFLDGSPMSLTRRIQTRPLQLQSTGLGVVIGLSILVLLMAVLWWWRGAEEPALGRLNGQTEFGSAFSSQAGHGV